MPPMEFWLASVAYAVFGEAKVVGRLSVTIAAPMPDRRRRDLDNLLKCALDCLTKAGIWEDDSTIDVLTITRGDVHSPGWLDVEITPIETKTA